MKTLATLALAGWTYLALFHGRFWRTGPLLRPAPPLPLNQYPRVAAVIPARDEAATVSLVVQSLRAQSYAGPLRIWVVDDDSSDGTAELARAAGGDQTAVLQAGLLPSGWTGKLWALSRGVESALSWNPEYLLFTDADVQHSHDSLQELVARAEAERLDIASCMVRLHCSTLAERITIPAFVFFFFMLYPPARIRDVRWRTAGAAGGCILIRTAALRRIGGLRSIRSELIDDCALARAVKQSGGRLRLALTSNTKSLRVYRTFAEVERMIARTAFTQLGYSSLALAGTIIGLCLLYAVPPVAALLGSRAGVAGWALLSAMYLPMVRFYGQPAVLAPLLPFTAMFYAGATIHSAVRFWSGRGGSWKGRDQAAPTAARPPAMPAAAVARVPGSRPYPPQGNNGRYRLPAPDPDATSA